ncbi:hypothetical protein ACOHYD_10955 [Desulfobacterota bacterium M19]
MAKRIRRRKCRNCGELYHPDHRNRKKQRYCSKADCRAASKRASNLKWRQKEENRDYFSGPDQVARVQKWRKLKPGYSAGGPKKQKTLQDHSTSESPATKDNKGDLKRISLQDYLSQQSPVLIGLIAKLTENTLQDDIANAITNMRELGWDILNNVVEDNKKSIHYNGGSYDNKRAHRPAANSQGAG